MSVRNEHRKKLEAFSDEILKECEKKGFSVYEVKFLAEIFPERAIQSCVRKNIETPFNYVESCKKD